ncbi:ATP-grasp fold amidoligase family protein, partial [Alistipes putredinis]
ETLSCGIPFLRVDFYTIGMDIFFGELTFFPTSGMTPFEPEDWDYKFGEWLTLPPKTR